MFKSSFMSGHILIVDDLSINRTILRARLSAACYTCTMAATGQDAVSMAQAHLPDLILLDYQLPDIDGQAVCHALRNDARTRDIPVILFSASNERHLRLQALAAGADDFLSKPLDESYLLGRIRSLLRRRDARATTPTDWAPTSQPMCMAEPSSLFHSQRRVAIVADEEPHLIDPALTHIVDGGLVSYLSVSQALRMDPGGAAPDLILLGPAIIHAQGLQVIAELRSRQATRDVDLCLLLPAGQDLMAAMALDLGASEVLRLPLDPDEARLRLTAILRARDQHRAQARAMAAQLDQALRDPLTGLFNRRHLVSELWRLGRSGALYPDPVGAVLVLDLDHFKSVNDRFGHNAGDDVLVDIATRIRHSLRNSDILARYGGEEFVVLLPGATLQTAQQIATRIAKAIERVPCLPELDGRGVLVTASIGVAAIERTADDQSPEDFARLVIGTADSALRAAKAGGRNRVVTGSAALA